MTETEKELSRGAYYSKLPEVRAIFLASSYLGNVQLFNKGDYPYDEAKKLLNDAGIALSKAATLIHESVCKAKIEAEKRSMPLLVQLCTRRMLEIPQEIEVAIKEFESVKKRYDAKREELEKRSFAQDQIDAILSDDDKPNHPAHQAKLAQLKAEDKALADFCKDYPRYDQNKLIGTSFQNWQP